MSVQNNKIFSGFRIWLSVLIGLLVVIYMIYTTLSDVRYFETEPGKGSFVWHDVNGNGIVDKELPAEFTAQAGGNYQEESFVQAWKSMHWSWQIPFFIFLALLMMVVRDMAYIWRIRVLTEKQLSWRSSMNVILIWEFASAVTPGVVGGAAVAMFILNREKLALGKATTLVMITALMDELFYLLVVPLVILITGTQALFPEKFLGAFPGHNSGIQLIFWSAFGIIAGITFSLFTAIFIFPGGFRRLLILLTRLRWLKRFQQRAEKLGDDILVSAAEVKDKPFSFWFKAFSATMLSWTGRFLVINFLLLAFVPVIDHFTVFARQLSMWVILLVSPTPGGSGVAEFAFSGFLSDLLPFGFAGLLAVLWRLISYYLYLLIGAIVLPVWLRKTAGHHT